MIDTLLRGKMGAPSSPRHWPRPCCDSLAAAFFVVMSLDAHSRQQPHVNYIRVTGAYLAIAGRRLPYQPLRKINVADILLIEDSLEVGQVIIEHLSAIGHTTVQATTIDHARELLISKKIDLVLADQLLPKGYGTAVTEDTSRLGIPLLLMTGHPETYEALRDGALPVLRKPFHLSELTEAIDGALAGGKA